MTPRKGGPRDLSEVNAFIVDDDEFARGFLARVLEKLGVNVVASADNGTAALAALETCAQPVDVMISDIEMPEMDGYQLARKIRYGTVPAYKDLPILIITGKDTPENARKARIHKIEGFIVKPPDPRDMEHRLRDVLGL